MTKEEFKQKFKEGVHSEGFPVWDWKNGCLSFEDIYDFGELAWEILGDDLEAKDVKIFQLEARIKALLDENREATKRINELESTIEHDENVRIEESEW